MLMKNKIIFKNIAIIGFLIISKLSVSQPLSLKDFEESVSIMDSVIKHKNLTNLVEHNFNGKIDSLSSIDGTLFLTHNEKEIKYVLMFDVRKKKKIEYYTSNNELVLVAEYNRFILIRNKIVYIFYRGDLPAKQEQIELEDHLTFFTTLKNLWCN